MPSKLPDNKDKQLKVERLYEQYRYLMYKEANKILQDKFLAEDAVQQSFLKVISNLQKIDINELQQTRNFMVIICINVAKNIYNKNMNLFKQNDMVQDNYVDIADNNNDPQDILVDKDSVKKIVDAIDDLSPIYREMLMLKRTLRYSREKIAELLNIPEETVKKRLARARKILSQALNRYNIRNDIKSK